VDGGGVDAVESVNEFAMGEPSPPQPELLSSSSAASSAWIAMAGMDGVWLWLDVVAVDSCEGMFSVCSLARSPR
jgi:hypothetical protein